MRWHEVNQLKEKKELSERGDEFSKFSQCEACFTTLEAKLNERALGGKKKTAFFFFFFFLGMITFGLGESHGFTCLFFFIY